MKRLCFGKREVVSRATKRAYRAAKSAGKPITWKAARSLGERWAVKMWPDFFEAENPKAGDKVEEKKA